MKKKLKENEDTNGIEELKKFYIRKKQEQEALKKLLKALDKKSLDQN